MKFLAVGIDAALASTGWGAVYGSTTDDVCVLGYGVIETAAEMGLVDRLTLLRGRVRDIVRAQWGHGVPERVKRHQVLVAIEQTDFTAGKDDDRARWVRETRAREALAYGVCAAVLACDDCGIVPQLVGPNEWQRELGVVHRRGVNVKQAVARLVAMQFENEFERAFVNSRKRDAARNERSDELHPQDLVLEEVVVERATGKPAASHVTDALGLAYVTLQRRCAAARLERVGETQELFAV